MSSDWITLRARTMTGRRDGMAPMRQTIRLSSLKVHWNPEGALIVSNDRGIATQLVEDYESLRELATKVGLEDVPAECTKVQRPAPLPWETA